MAVYTDWTVGRLVTADRLNDNLVEEREDTTSITSDSTTWNGTEAATGNTVTSDLVDGLRYKIWFIGRISSDVAADTACIRIREDNLAGTQLNMGFVTMTTTSGNGWSIVVHAEYTAVATAAKTFALTGQRTIGAGTAHRVRGTATGPGYLVCEKVMD